MGPGKLRCLEKYGNWFQTLSLRGFMIAVAKGVIGTFRMFAA